MLLHIDASKHAWFGDGRYYDLITLLDDATSEIYYAQLVVEEGTRTLMPAVQEVIEQQGIFCALYSDRASHFFVTPQAGGKVDESQVTQLGRALQELGIKMIPAYSPQARGRMERSYRTWQGRLPPELRLRKITTVEQANPADRKEPLAEHPGRLHGQGVRVARWHGDGAVRAARGGSVMRLSSAMVLSGFTRRSCWRENTHARSLRRVRTNALPLPAAATAKRRLNSVMYSWRRKDSLPAPQPKMRGVARPLGHQRRAA